MFNHLKVFTAISCLMLSATIWADIRVWVSATSNDGNLGDRAGADALCDADGNKPSVPGGTTRAFISISASDEIRDMPASYGIATNEIIYRSDGTTQIASNYAALLDTSSTSLVNAIDTSPQFIWTFSDDTGALDANNCSGGASTAGNGFRGNVSSTDTNSLALSSGACSASHGLYCITYAAPNTAPTFTNLNGTPSYTIGGAAQVLDNDVTVADTELDALSSSGNYDAATLTISRNGGSNTNDVFGNSGSLGALTQGGALTFNSTSYGTVTTNSNGTLLLTFSDASTIPTTAIVNSILQNITYSNSSNSPAASVTLDWVFSDGFINTSGTNQTTVSISSSPEQAAINLIAATANQAAAPAPTAQDYLTAGVTGADETALNRILSILNRAVAQQASSDDVNELSEIQALLDVVLQGQDTDGDGLPNILEGNTDTDNDAITDNADTDADNDGIADSLELALAITDTDEDGIIDWFDADTDGDGTLNEATLDANLDGVNDSRDTFTEIMTANPSLDIDQDGLIHSLDLDSDNDSVPDLIEAGHSDADDNGLLDEGSNVISESGLLPDSDQDGTANFLQLLSDGQQRDLLSLATPETLDANGDGRLDSLTDLDNDGLMDVVDNAIGAFGSYRDMDNDGIPNHLDDDDDNDGIPDFEENNNKDFLNGRDADADGIDDGIDFDVNGVTQGEDTNNNGIQDALELPDTDNDGIADYLDNDSDNDGVTDDKDPSINTGTDVETGQGALGYYALGLFMLVVACKRPWFAFASLLLLTSLARGHGQHGFDIAAHTGVSSLRPETNNGLKLTNENSWSNNIEVGYRLNNHWRVKGRYSDLGHAKVEDAKINYRAHIVAGEYRMQILSAFESYGALGFSRLSTTTDGGLNQKQRQSNQLYVNAGMRYLIAPTFYLSLEASSYSSDSQEITTGMLLQF